MPAQFEVERSAFIALDFQNYGLHPDGYWGKQGWPVQDAAPAVAATARVLAAARAKGLRVIHVGAAWRPGSPDMNMSIPAFAAGPDRSVEGTWSAAFFDPVAPAPGELVVWKRSIGAFAGTELDRLLRLLDVRTLVLAGIVTNFSVEGTAREAADRGYRVIVLEDCCHSMPDMHAFAVEKILPVFCTVSTSKEFLGALGG
jgi:gluconolactonase